MSKEYEAFIFDLDGVITDTAEFHFKAWKRLADEEGIPFNRETNEDLRGVSRRKSLEIILNGRAASEESIEEMMARKNSYYQDFIARITSDDMLPGAKEILEELKEKGYKLAVASASKNAKPVIENLDISDIFDTISDGYSVKNTKPAPDLFLHTAEKMGVEPIMCAVFEDAEAGIEAALEAGMTAIGIGPEERVGKAHFRYDEVKDVDLNEILS
ncbi:MAG: beta-phosphoglucomutase [Halanaerobiales bacterium]